MPLLIAISIYLIKHRNKKKLLPYHDTSKLKEFDITHILIKIMKSNNKLEKIDIKNPTSFYFDDITEIEDFNFYNALINDRSNENVLVYDISYLIGAKNHCVLGSIK